MEISVIMKYLVEVNINGQMVKLMMDSGRRIKCMGMAL